MFKKLLDILRSELQCPICLDQFEDPQLTNCGHSYCNKCIQEIFTSANSMCPLCKRRLSRKGVIQNSKVSQIMSQLRELKEADTQDEIQQHSLFKVCEEPKSDLSSRPSLYDAKDIVILATALNWQLKDDFDKFAKRFGCRVVIAYSTSITHLVVGFDDQKAQKPIFKSSSTESKKVIKHFEAKRTVKFLQAMIHGKWILSYKWIIHSLMANQLLNEEDFEIYDDGHALGTVMKSRLGGGMGQLFKDMVFYMAGSSQPLREKGIQNQDLEWMIIECGGSLTENKDGIRIRICDKNNPSDQKSKKPTFSHLWVLDSISNFALQELESYEC